MIRFLIFCNHFVATYTKHHESIDAGNGNGWQVGMVIRLNCFNISLGKFTTDFWIIILKVFIKMLYL